jgi:hypothetical protein
VAVEQRLHDIREALDDLERELHAARSTRRRSPRGP